MMGTKNLIIFILVLYICPLVLSLESLDTFISLFWSNSSNYLLKVLFFLLPVFMFVAFSLVIQYYPSTGDLSEYWNYAESLDSVLDGVALQQESCRTSDSLDYAAYVEMMYDAQDAIGWYRDYYDDMNWMSMALLRAHTFLQDDKYLETAQSLFTEIEGAWDTTCCGSHKGGIWWDTAHSQKASASNAGPVVRLAERLY